MNVIEELEDRFVESAAAARQALEAARADPSVKGSRGQLVAHPGFGLAGKTWWSFGWPPRYGWPAGGIRRSPPPMSLTS